MPCARTVIGVADIAHNVTAIAMVILENLFLAILPPD